MTVSAISVGIKTSGEPSLGAAVDKGRPGPARLRRSQAQTQRRVRDAAILLKVPRRSEFSGIIP